MRKHDLPSCPQWLLDADTENENVTLKNGILQWWGGNFQGGNFWDGDFRGGNFLGGNFRGGNFRGGNFLGGNFRGGDFLGGDFLGGNFLGGNFQGGEFRGGEFRGGNFRGGNFWGGNFWGGNFWGGNFLGGDFLGGNFLYNKNPIQYKLLFDWGPGFVFIGRETDFVRIRIGCRFFESFEEAVKHWEEREDRKQSLRVIKAFQHFIQETVGPRT